MCAYGDLPSIDDPHTRTDLKLDFGMDQRFVEPWFECDVRQRFNDGLSGYVDG